MFNLFKKKEEPQVVLPEIIQQAIDDITANPLDWDKGSMDNWLYHKAGKASFRLGDSYISRYTTDSQRLSLLVEGCSSVDALASKELVLSIRSAHDKARQPKPPLSQYLTKPKAKKAK